MSKFTPREIEMDGKSLLELCFVEVDHLSVVVFSQTRLSLACIVRSG